MKPVKWLEFWIHGYDLFLCRRHIFKKTIEQLQFFTADFTAEFPSLVLKYCASPPLGNVQFLVVQACNFVMSGNVQCCIERLFQFTCTCSVLHPTLPVLSFSHMPTNPTKYLSRGNVGLCVQITCGIFIDQHFNLYWSVKTFIPSINYAFIICIFTHIGPKDIGD